jgi:uncharacterized membrane protein YqaE (UPF0057 family)
MSGYNIEMNNGVNKTNKKEFAENKNGKAVKTEKSKNVEAEVVQEQPEVLIAYDSEVADKNLMSTTENYIVLSSSSKINNSKIESSPLISKKKSISAIKSYFKARMHQPAFKESSSEEEILLIILCFLLPPLAVGLATNWDTKKTIISIVLSLFFWVPGIIYALIVVLT